MSNSEKYYWQSNEGMDSQPLKIGERRDGNKIVKVEIKKMVKLSKKQRMDAIKQIGLEFSVKIKQGKDKEKKFFIFEIFGCKVKVEQIMAKILETMVVAEYVSIPEAIPPFALDCLYESMKRIEDSYSCKITIVKGIGSKGQGQVIIRSPYTIDGLVEEVKSVLQRESLIAFEKVFIPKLTAPWLNGPGNRRASQIKVETGCTHVLVDSEEGWVFVRGEYVSRLKCKEKISEIISQYNPISLLVKNISNCERRYLKNNINTVNESLLETADIYLQSIRNGAKYNEIYLVCKTGTLYVKNAMEAINKVLKKQTQQIVPVHTDYALFFLAKIKLEYKNQSDLMTILSDSNIILSGSTPIVTEASQKLNLLLSTWSGKVERATMPLNIGHKHLILRDDGQLNGSKSIYQDFIAIHEEQLGRLVLIGPKHNIQPLIDDIKSRVKKAKKLFVQNIEVDPSFYRYIIGEKGTNINSLRNKFMVDIVIPSVNDLTKRNQITVRGEERQNVLQCVADIKEKIDLANECDEMDVAKSLHKYIVGHQGNKLTEIIRSSRAEIFVPSLSDASTIIRIKGNRQEIDCAKKIIRSIVENLCCKSVTVPDHCLRAKGTGLALKTMYLRICPKAVQVEGTEKKGTFLISGAKENVNLYESKLQEIIEEKNLSNNSSIQDEENKENSFKVKDEPHQPQIKSLIRREVIVDPSSIPRLIGKGGIFIKDFELANNVKVRFNVEKNRKELAVVIGSREGDVNRAVEKLQNLSFEIQTFKQQPHHLQHHYYSYGRQGVEKEIGQRSSQQKNSLNFYQTKSNNVYLFDEDMKSLLAVTQKIKQ